MFRRVALRKESVDRNTHTTTTTAAVLPSLSARRAWIEISGLPVAYRSWPVALRKESVDRNNDLAVAKPFYRQVALRKESVDRNIHSHSFIPAQRRRSPQGERG